VRNSFTKIQIVDDEVEVIFAYSIVPMVSREFIKDSFTRDLMELIEPDEEIVCTQAVHIAK